MRIAIFALAVLAGGGAAEAGQIEVISASPRHIEIAAWCRTAGSNCQQEASDVAQGYCHGAALGAASEAGGRRGSFATTDRT